MSDFIDINYKYQFLTSFHGLGMILMVLLFTTRAKDETVRCLVSRPLHAFRLVAPRAWCPRPPPFDAEDRCWAGEGALCEQWDCCRLSEISLLYGPGPGFCSMSPHTINNAVKHVLKRKVNSLRPNEGFSPWILNTDLSGCKKTTQSCFPTVDTYSHFAYNPQIVLHRKYHAMFDQGTQLTVFKNR